MSRAAFALAAALLAAVPARAEAPLAQPESFEVEGAYVTIAADGSRFVEFPDERRGLFLAPSGDAILSDASGNTISKGRWNSETGELEGIEGLPEHRLETVKKAALAAQPARKVPVMPPFAGKAPVEERVAPDQPTEFVDD